MKQFKLLPYLVMALMLVMVSCDKDKPEPKPEPGDTAPEISQLSVTPSSDVSYGDVLSLTGILSHETGLQSYTVQIAGSDGILYENMQLLTGKSYELKESVTLPLPKNAESDDLKLSVIVKDSKGGSATGELTISNVEVPEFEELYIILSNNKVITMTHEEGLFSAADFFPANAAGKIYSNSDKSGLFWGMEKGEVVSLGKDNIVFGEDEESSFEVIFDPKTFDLTINDAEVWEEIDDPLYILGGISGHWADGEITTEREKMRMTGYQSGDQKYWSWTPPSDGTGDPETDMWGAIVAGQFRFKVGGEEQYITYQNGMVNLGADDPASSFEISTGGAFEIKVFYNGDKFDKVLLQDENKSLEYRDGDILINGVAIPNAINFASTGLDLVEGTYFTYEGIVELSNGQSVSASGVDLKTAVADPDVFSGSGNANWKVVGPDGEYLVRIEPFSGMVYVCKLDGYPEVIYLDGWSFNKSEFIEKPAWDESTRICLYRNGDSYTYTGTIFVLPWGGDASLWAAPYTDENAGEMGISSEYFEGVERAGDGFLIPVPAEPGAYYKMTVDLKDGFVFEIDDDGGSYELVPNNGKKFTIGFEQL